MLLGTLATSILGNALTRNWALRADERVIKTGQNF